MKNRIPEKAAAVTCALVLAIGVMSGGVLAKDSDPLETPAIFPEPPEATFVVMDLDLSSSPADAETTPDALPASDTEASDTSALEFTDNRSSVPLLIAGETVGDCPIIGGIPYADADAFCRALGLDVNTSVTDDTFTITGAVNLTAHADDIYFICNGRYIPAEKGVRLQSGKALLPVRGLTKCLGVTAYWDRVQWTVSIDDTDVSLLTGGADFYDETDLYWLSHVIYAEAGNQSLRGQVGVGNVVMNRLASDSFAGQDTVYDVIFAKNQFDVVSNGMIYMEPDSVAMIAARLALEGFDVTGGATYFATFDFGEGYECLLWIEDHCFMVEA